MIYTAVPLAQNQTRQRHHHCTHLELCQRCQDMPQNRLDTEVEEWFAYVQRPQHSIRVDLKIFERGKGGGGGDCKEDVCKLLGHAQRKLINALIRYICTYIHIMSCAMP